MNTTNNTAHGEYKVPGGKLVVVDLAIAGGRMTAVQVSGDFFLEPDSALDTINAALEGLSIATAEAGLAAAVAAALGPEPRMFGITPEGVAAAVRRALDAAPGGDDPGGRA
ncbi:biotin--protein ligase [Luteimonas terricola]|uniref:biotin--protein ligase n=1 Tax=Luteimonas terricola TaxID=645597 RepID=UPI0010538B87|nr:biotin--protein ligase [Luteimonas terricola]